MPGPCVDSWPCGSVVRKIDRVDPFSPFNHGLLGGVGLFVATAWLLIRGGPEVGLHLGLLGQYLPGYRVTWVGCVVGFFYGSLVGGALGWSLAWIYNALADRRQGR